MRDDLGEAITISTSPVSLKTGKSFDCEGAWKSDGPGARWLLTEWPRDRCCCEREIVVKEDRCEDVVDFKVLSGEGDTVATLTPCDADAADTAEPAAAVVVVGAAVGCDEPSGRETMTGKQRKAKAEKKRGIKTRNERTKRER